MLQPVRRRGKELRQSTYFRTANALVDLLAKYFAPYVFTDEFEYL